MFKPRTFAGTLFLLLAASPLHAGVILSEGFNNIATLAGSGWALVNNSSPAGSTGWFQGNTGVFGSQAGAPDSYIAANFDNAAFGGNVSNWLITPVVSLQYDLQFVFFTRTEVNSIFPDRLELRFSTNGSSTNVGATDSSVGDFTNLLLTVNPTLAVGVYPDGWAQITVNLVGATVPASGRFAFRYDVTDTSTNADYIGIDSLTVTQNAPEPGTMALIAAGLVCVSILRSRRARTSGGSMKLVQSIRSANRAITIALLAVAVCAVEADAQQPATSPANAQAKSPSTAAPQQSAPPAGMVVFIDPATGKIRQPDAEEIGALTGNTSRATAAPAAAPLDMISGPGGAVGIKLGEDSMSYMVVTKTSDGKLAEDCVTGEKAAAALLSKGAAPGVTPKTTAPAKKNLVVLDDK